MKKIEINVPEHPYNVYLGKGNFSKIKSLLKKENISGDILLIIDSNVNKYYNQLITSSFNGYQGKVKNIYIHSSEKNKSYSTLQKIHNYLIKHNFGRDSIIVAIGGGIIGDIAGFAASTYMRGIKFVQIPTTLLASVDSSVGGKTGINFINTKNVIGSFYQPRLVLIDSNFFDTLPNEERLCGLGEIIKYAYLTNNRFFSYVEKNSEKILSNHYNIIAKVISESINFKGSVVEADEKESGIRKVLNLGHTFAHAFEVEQKHKIKHGQAVIVGIACALQLSKELELLSNSKFEVFLTLVTKFNADITLGKVDINQIYKIMQRDKKNRKNEIMFVLIKDIGEILTDISVGKQLVQKSISTALDHFN